MHKKKGTKRKRILTVNIILSLILILTICFLATRLSPNEQEAAVSGTDIFELADIPEYTGSPYIEINNNLPSFSDKDLVKEAFEHYSNLDDLGRCGAAFANVGPETMPEEERGPIGEVHPSGWQVANYHDLIEGNYLYNRCHLIAFSLTGENANEKNLITGTRYLNTEGMQPFELEVLEYVRTTGNHVLYRVTPVFKGDNLVASGVEMEALSVEDKGAGICFHIYAYNVQPGVIIDYRTGDNKPDPNYDGQEQVEERYEPAEEKTVQEAIPENSTEGTSEADNQGVTYILNTNTHKFHYPSCDSVVDIKEKNKVVSMESRDKIMEEGYQPCGRCKP
ncbi:MAG: DNA/RNA non-specific endonuclease [Eubacterium sp.]|nr:DNA/RNA non-specific endonuclease [Eubacterium sp.]